MDRDETRQHRVEFLCTVLLAVAAVATAWTTYQSQRWRGEQAADSTKATAAHIASSQASTRAGQLTQIDIATFTQWVDADTAGTRKLARFYRRRFRKEFRPAFAAWIATSPLTNPGAPLTPFAMRQYRVAEAARSERLNTAAGVHANAAGEANQRGGDYVLALVLFAVALFFAGMSTKLRSLGKQEVLLALGWVVFLGTAVWVATFPVSLSAYGQVASARGAGGGAVLDGPGPGRDERRNLSARRRLRHHSHHDSGGHRVLRAGDGGADAHWRQAWRYLGPASRFHGRPLHLWAGVGADRRLLERSQPDARLVGARGHRGGPRDACPGRAGGDQLRGS